MCESLDSSGHQECYSYRKCSCLNTSLSESRAYSDQRLFLQVASMARLESHSCFLASQRIYNKLTFLKNRRQPVIGKHAGAGGVLSGSWSSNPTLQRSRACAERAGWRFLFGLGRSGSIKGDTACARPFSMLLAMASVAFVACVKSAWHAFRSP